MFLYNSIISLAAINDEVSSDKTFFSNSQSLFFISLAMIKKVNNCLNIPYEILLKGV